MSTDPMPDDPRISAGWRNHAGCLAERIRRTLTGGDHG